MALWTPAEIATELWLDAKDSVTLALNASDEVDQWDDKSGNGRHAIGFGTYKPLFSAAALSGQPAVVFDPLTGIPDRLEITGWDDELTEIAVTEDMTIFVIFARPTSGIRSIPIGDSVAPPVAWWWNTDDVTYSMVSGSSFSTHGTADTSTGAFFQAVQRDAANVSMWRNGQALGAPQPAVSPEGRFRDIGRGAQSNNGPIGEIVVVSGDSSTETRQFLEGYAAWKWGLQSSLPADHPHKDAAPEIPVPSAIISVPPPLLSPAALGVIIAERDAWISAPSPLSAPSVYGLVDGASIRISAPSPLGPASIYAINDFTGQFPGSLQIYYYANFNTGTNRIVLPISSWQATLQSGERSSYVQCVVPAAEQYIDAITSAGVGTRLAIMRGAIYPGGVQREMEIASVLIDQFPYQRGPRRATVTLSGYGRLKFYNVDEEAPPPSAIRQLPGVQTLTVHGGVRARCEIDWFLRPGMLAQADGVQFWVSYINYYANQNRQFMEVGERPL